MSAKAIEAMNRKRYGKRGKKPSAQEIQDAIKRQSPTAGTAIEGLEKSGKSESEFEI